MPPVCGCVYVRGDVIYTITTQKVHQRPGCPITPYGVAMVSLHNPPTCTAHPPTCTYCYGWGCQWPGTKDPTSAKVPRQQEIGLSLKKSKNREGCVCPLEGMVKLVARGNPYY